jgi:hypothetical protein
VQLGRRHAGRVNTRAIAALATFPANIHQRHVAAAPGRDERVPALPARQEPGQEIKALLGR